MTKAEIKRLVQASIEAVRKHNVPYVDVKIGDDAVVRIPLKPEDKPADNSPATDYDDWGS
jgi:hypothetical protein